MAAFDRVHHRKISAGSRLRDAADIAGGSHDLGFDRFDVRHLAVAELRRERHG